MVLEYTWEHNKIVLGNLKRQTVTQQNQQEKETQTKKLQLVQDTLLLIQQMQSRQNDRTQKQTNIKFVIIGEDYEWKKGQPDRNKPTTHER